MSKDRILKVCVPGNNLFNEDDRGRITFYFPLAGTVAKIIYRSMVANKLAISDIAAVIAAPEYVSSVIELFPSLPINIDENESDGPLVLITNRTLFDEALEEYCSGVIDKTPREGFVSALIVDDLGCTLVFTETLNDTVYSS